MSRLALTLILAVFSHSTLTNAAPQVTTVPAMSQISDGQPQAPYNTAVSGSSVSWPTSSGSYENPFTIYTTQTNSLGVITGMPSVVTSQPSVITSQPASPTLPSTSVVGYANSTMTTTTDSDTGTDQTSTLGATSLSQTTEAGTTANAGTSGSATATATANSGSTRASATFAQATGGAVSNRITVAGAGLVALGLGFSFL